MTKASAILDPGYSLTLRPLKYPALYDMFVTAQKNNWTVQELKFQDDITHLHSRFSPAKSHLIKRLVAFFATGDTIVSNNLVINLYQHINAPEARMFLGRQLFEECFAKGTEILTEKGWVDFADLTTEKVAQFDPITSEISFVIPTHKTRYHYEGDMIEFDGQRLHQCVTPNHRICFRRYGEKSYKFTEAKNMSFSRNNVIPVAGNKPAGRTALTAKERFLIALQADGYVVRRNSTTGYNYNGKLKGTIPVKFCFAKQRKIKRIKGIIEDIGWKYSETLDRNHNRTIVTAKVPITEFISKDFDWVDLENVSSEWCLSFLDEIVRWDGSIAPNGGRRYCTTNKKCFDVVQAVGALCGMRVSPSRVKLPSGKIYYTASLVPKPVVVAEVSKSYKPYKGEVFCVTVPTGAIVIRSNSHVSVSGNCLHVQAYLTLLDNYLPDPEERNQAFAAVDNIPSIKRKADFCFKYIDSISQLTRLETKAQRKQFLLNLICFASCIEGLFFFGAFAYVYFLRDEGLLPGLAMATNFIFKEETMHMTFAFKVIEIVRKEEPDLFDNELMANVRAMIKEAVECEMQFAEDVLDLGVPGMSVKSMREYLQYVADQRFSMLGLPIEYGSRCPFDFMLQQDVQELSNFFERSPTAYSVGVTGSVSFDADFLK
jgi:ribonucleoside-diphosphate reductase beta chain